MTTVDPDEILEGVSEYVYSLGDREALALLAVHAPGRARRVRRDPQYHLMWLLEDGPAQQAECELCGGLDDEDEMRSVVTHRGGWVEPPTYALCCRDCADGYDDGGY